MATTFCLRALASSLGGAGQLLLSENRGYNTAGATAVTSTTAGGTNIVVTQTGGGTALAWFSEGITEAVTISGTITINVRGREAANTVNAGAGILIERTNSAGAVQSTIVADTTIPATITEWGTTDSARNRTATPTSTAMAIGERIKVTLKVRNVGTMAANASGVTNTYDSNVTAAIGDTYITFTEDIRTDQPIDRQAPYAVAGMYGSG